MSRLFDPLHVHEDADTAEAYRFPTSKNAVRAFYTPTPTHLAVADKPPRLGGTIRQVPLAEFCDEHNIVWTDSPVITEEYHRQLWLSGQIKPIKDYAEHRILNPLPMVLADMGEMGLGVFLSEEAEPIKEGDIVFATYSGLLLNDVGEIFNFNDNPYAFNLSESNQLLVAEKYRGISAFFQHAPTDHQLREKTYVDPKLEGKIFAANLTQEIFIHYGVPTVAFYARRDIAPGDPLVFGYGIKYWEGKDCFVINAEGMIIGTMNDDEIKACHDLPEYALKTQLQYDFKDSVSFNANVDGFEYGLAFIKNMALYLQQEMILNDCMSSRFQYAAMFYDALVSGKDVDDAWSNIKIVLKNLKSMYQSDQSIHDLVNKVFCMSEIYRLRKEKSDLTKGKDSVDLSDLPFNSKPEDRNYMIRFAQEVKKIISSLNLKTPELQQRKEEILSHISQCKTSDDVYRYLVKCSPDWKKENSSFKPLIQPLIQLMKSYNAAQKVAKNYQDYVAALQEEYKAQLAMVSENDAAASARVS